MLVSAQMSDPAEAIQKMTKNPFTEGPEGSLYNPTSFAGGELVSVQKVGLSTFTLAFTSVWSRGTPAPHGYQEFVSDSQPRLLRVDSRSGSSVIAPPTIPNQEFASGEDRFVPTQSTLVGGASDGLFHFLAYWCTGSDGKRYVMISAHQNTEGSTYFNLSRFFSTEGLEGELVSCTLRGDRLLFTFSDGESLQFVEIPRETFFAKGPAVIRLRNIWGSSGWGVESEPTALEVGPHSSVSSFEYRNRLVMLLGVGEKTDVYTFDERVNKLAKKTTLNVPNGRAHPALVSQGSSIPVSTPDQQLNTTPFRQFTNWTSFSYDIVAS